MTRIRRIVTGIDNGQHVFREVSPVAPRVSTTEWYGILGWDSWLDLPVGPDEQFIPASSFPEKSARQGVRVVMAEFPPADRVSAAVSGQAGAERMREYRPDGMHSTESIDIVFVITGTILLSQADTPELELGPGDCVVQNGTEHRWRNPGSEPALLGFVVLAAEDAG